MNIQRIDAIDVNLNRRQNIRGNKSFINKNFITDSSLKTTTFKGILNFGKPSSEKFAKHFLTPTSQEDFFSNITKTFPEAKGLLNNENFIKQILTLQKILTDTNEKAHEFLTQKINNPDILKSLTFMIMGSIAAETYNYDKKVYDSQILPYKEREKLKHNKDKTLGFVLDKWSKQTLPSFVDLPKTAREDILSSLKLDFKPGDLNNNIQANQNDIEAFSKLSDDAKKLTLAYFLIQNFENDSSLNTVKIFDSPKNEIIDNIRKNAINELGLKNDTKMYVVKLVNIFGKDKEQLISNSLNTIDPIWKEYIEYGSDTGIKIIGEKEFLNKLYSTVNSKLKDDKKSMDLTLQTYGKINKAIKKTIDNNEKYESYVLKDYDFFDDVDKSILWLDKTGFWLSDNQIYSKFGGDELQAFLLAYAFKNPEEKDSIDRIKSFLDSDSNNYKNSEWLVIMSVFDPTLIKLGSKKMHLTKEEFLKPAKYLPEYYKSKLYTSKFNKHYQDI